jgi:carbon storage regulator CsrA
MFVISRQAGEMIMIGDDVVVTVESLRGKSVTLDVRHTSAGGRLTLDDSFRRDVGVDDSIDLPVPAVCSVVDIRGDKVRLGIVAPKEVSVHRKEVYDAIRRENRRDRGNI